MDNKKYYYIKLKDNYFDQDNIKILESLTNGYIYSLIILKLYLKAAKNDGRLMMTPTIPYDPENIEVLAGVINHDIDHVKQAILNAVKLDIITIVDGRELWMTEIQNMIGHSSTEADRIRRYRKRITENQESKAIPFETEKKTNNQDSQLLKADSSKVYKCTPEIEKEKEKEKEIEIEIEKEKKADYVDLVTLLMRLIEGNDAKYFKAKDKSSVADKWYDHVRLLIEKDGRSSSEVRQIIEWSQSNDFWKANILSTKKLREKFPQLLLQMKNQKQKCQDNSEVPEEAYVV